MAKASIYMASRTVKRLSKETIKNAINHFVSTGAFVGGSSELGAEVVNYALERHWTVKIYETVEGCVTVYRET